MIEDYLSRNGPTRSSVLAAELQKTGMTAENARQRLSRAQPPVQRFPLRLLPKKEAFFYLESQRNRDIFWDNFLRDLRGSGSIFACAIDGMLARGRRLTKDEFTVISGAPARPTKGQLNAERVLETLVKASFLSIETDDANRTLFRYQPELYYPVETSSKAEMIVLDGMREWARNLGFASYNTIAIRNDPNLVPIGPFQFDLAGPSWFAPLQNSGGRPGFLVADVFADGTLDAHHIQYFIRKIAVLRALRNGPRVMPMLVAESFTGPALTAGHAAGISLATPGGLFGARVGAAISSLAQTLKNVAAYASSETSDRIVGLVNDLSQINGRNGNIRGVLFELVAGYLARRDAKSIDMGVIARDPATNKTADIDVLKVESMDSAVTCIECKGKEPGGVITAEEVQNWLSKIPTMRAYLASHSSFREAQHRFELWTSGTFDSAALALLKREKANRTRTLIDWKDGKAVLELATKGKEKKIADALREHFFDHPLAAFPDTFETFNTVRAEKPSGLPPSSTTTLAIAGPKT
ncbi:hypothetical protein [Henriciella aquimarina]|uniref:hypothetical protein n=1 Tax=Henriciella aquimarina TaxID=545261 RepID=UPI00117AF4E7|nr:hypothetical protein [Henriciella aquimarina]